jgi:hypothetical protein
MFNIDPKPVKQLRAKSKVARATAGGFIAEPAHRLAKPHR